MTVSRRTCLALLVWFAFSAQASAKGTGYLFVSNERMNNVVVIDPKQDYRSPSGSKHLTDPEAWRFATIESSFSSPAEMMT
jgi:hypothetical protein